LKSQKSPKEEVKEEVKEPTEETEHLSKKAEEIQLLQNDGIFRSEALYQLILLNQNLNNLVDTLKVLGGLDEDGK
jgi:hypothetical protein